jgi:hypothetical protein
MANQPSAARRREERYHGPRRTINADSWWRVQRWRTHCPALERPNAVAAIRSGSAPSSILRVWRAMSRGSRPWWPLSTSEPRLGSAWIGPRGGGRRPCGGACPAFTVRSQQDPPT